MKHLLRPYRNSRRLGCIALALAAASLMIAPHRAHAQAEGVVQFLEDPLPLLVHSGSQGYLGVDIADVDQEKAQALKLKEVRGAVITLIDHDAPAGKIGLKVNDVVLALNGQNVEGADQLRRMLREIPAGRTVSIVISRDGNIQTMAVELADRKVMEHEVWDKIDEGFDFPTPVPQMGIFAGGGGDVGSSTGFHMPFFGSSLKVGALVEPLTSQMAEYLGVNGGLMVKQVAHKSEAANAGFRAFDVILKVGPDSIATIADWERALRSNQGKPVQVTILRDRKQQTLTLQVDSKHRGAVEYDDLFPNGDAMMMAEADPDFAQELTAQAQAAREQAEQMRSQIQNQVQGQIDALRSQIGNMQLGLSPQQLDQIRKQAEQVRRQAGQLRKNFNPDQFKIDPQQMEQLRRQMEQFRQQMEQWQDQSFGHFV